MIKHKLDKYGILLFATGFAALVYEIVFFKTLSLFLGQSIYAFSVMLAAFMFGIAIGSVYSSKLKGEALWLFSLTQIGIGAYSIIFIPLLNKTYIPAFLISKLPFYLQNIFLIIVSLAILIIPTSLMGLSFPLLLKHVVEKNKDKKNIGRLYAYNTLGGLLGSLAAGFLLLPEFGVSVTLIIAAVINFSAALSIKTRNFSKRMGIVALLLIILFISRPTIDHFFVGSFYNTILYEDLESFVLTREESRRTSEVLYSDYDVYGHTSVLKTGQYKYLIINGKPDAGTSSDIVTQLMIGYIPMLLHENPQKAAVIGLGAGLTVGATLQFDAEQVDVYEINPGVVAANKYFEEESHQALADPRSKLILGDARRNLQASDESYDVIISEPSNPWIEGEGFLFTKEYYDIINDRLNENGIFVQWMGAYDYTEEAFNILMNTLHINFPYIQLWSDGMDYYIITSREPKRFKFTKTKQQINKPIIKTDFERIKYFDSKDLDYTDLFFSYFITNYKKTDEVKINTDDNSIIEFSTGRHSGESTDHLTRLTKNNMKTLPVDLSKNDFDIKFETKLPLFRSKYSIIQAGTESIISKQLVFKDKENTLFIQTTTQKNTPSLAQAEALAGNFKARVTRSEEHTYIIEGENSYGIIGYCPDVQQSFLGFSSTKAPLIINCKETNEE